MDDQIWGKGHLKKSLLEDSWKTWAHSQSWKFELLTFIVFRAFVTASNMRGKRKHLFSEQLFSQKTTADRDTLLIPFWRFHLCRLHRKHHCKLLHRDCSKLSKKVLIPYPFVSLCQILYSCILYSLLTYSDSSCLMFCSSIEHAVW